MNIEMTDLDMILNHLETTSLESHDDYTSEITYKDQKILYRYIKELQQERNQFKEYTNHNYDKAKQLQQENQQLKLELSGYRQAILNDKEMLGLKEENQQLKIQISAREEEYKKLEEQINEYRRLVFKHLQDKNKKLEDNWNKLKTWLKKELGDRTNPNKDKWLTGVYDAYRETIDKMQELERGVSDVED